MPMRAEWQKNPSFRPGSGISSYAVKRLNIALIFDIALVILAKTVLWE